MQIFTIDADSFDKFDLKDGDFVRVSDILDRYENRVSIEGSVFRPGSYAIGDKIQTVTDLVKYAEGTKEDAFLERALLYRENPDLTIRIESVNLNKLLNKEITDIKLQKNDRLYVPSKDELREERSVTLAGEVHRPGPYPYAHNMSIEDLILQGGGLLESASRAKIDVSRRIKNSLSTMYQTPITWTKKSNWLSYSRIINWG